MNSLIPQLAWSDVELEDLHSPAGTLSIRSELLLPLNAPSQSSLGLDSLLPIRTSS